MPMYGDVHKNKGKLKFNWKKNTTYQSRDQLSLDRFDQIELGSTHI